jgi:hypothetical protein
MHNFMQKCLPVLCKNLTWMGTDFMFMGPCVVNQCQSLSNKMQPYLCVCVCVCVCVHNVCVCVCVCVGFVMCVFVRVL